MLYDVYCAVDVGKSFHHVYATDQQGTVLVSRQIDQNESQLLEFFTGLGTDKSVLVVVDQPRNVGMLTLRCARHAGCDVRYLPGLSMRRAAGLLPGDAKTDARDAQVIAVTARTIPQSLLPVSDPDQIRAQVEAVNAYSAECGKDRTRHINRLRAVLVEVNPEFERALDEDVVKPLVLDMLIRFGGPWGIRDAGASRIRRWARGRKRTSQRLLDRSVAAAHLMTLRPVGWHAHEELSIPHYARMIRELDQTLKTNEKRLQTLLAQDPTYQTLLTMPGVGVRTASTLVTLIDISQFADHDKLASYCGLAARTTQSGTSIRGETAARAGNRTLKNALFQSAFASLRYDPKAREFYDTKRAAGKTHAAAIIALARKRLKIMFALMRDKTPYQA